VRPPFPGINLVTATSIFFFQPFGLSEFDHRAMEEVSRIEFRKEVEPLYGSERPFPCAFWLTHESVIWTNLNGSLMGVSRNKAADGKRKVWIDRLPNAGTSIAEFPLAWGDYLYFMDRGPSLGLYCFWSAPENARSTAGRATTTTSSKGRGRPAGSVRQAAARGRRRGR
jgi:hypothetical protein